MHLTIKEAVLIVCLSSIASSIGTVYVGQIAHQIPPLAGMGYVYFLGGVYFIVTQLLRRKKIIGGLSAEQRRSLCFYVIVRAVGAGLFSYALFYTSGAKAVFFTKIEPYLVMFWMWLMHKETPTAKNVVLLFVHIVGALILSVGDFSDFGVEQKGDLILCLAMVCFSLSYPSAKRLSQSIDPLSLSAVTNIVVGVLLYGTYTVWSGDLVDVSLVNTFDIFMPSFVGLYLGIGLWLYTVRSLEPWIASSLRTLGPLVAAPFAYFYFDQSLSWIQVVGALIVIITSVLISMQHAGPVKS